MYLTKALSYSVDINKNNIIKDVKRVQEDIFRPKKV